MQMRTPISAVAAAAALTVALGGVAHAADTLTVNGTPTDTWHYGTGNGYTPANTLVLATDAGDELDLRLHQTFFDAPASVGDVYHFALGTDPVSFDWGIDTSGTGSFDNVVASITLTRVGGGSFTYNPLFVPNDNSVANGSAQNSFRLNWAPINFDPTVNSTYTVQLTVDGLTGGSRTLTAVAQLGAGAAPEPAAWSMLLMGFGGLGAMLRRRRAAAATA